MAVGALIAAYQEDDAGGLRALLPLAGRTLLEYQARCMAAASASPIIVLVERIPAALNEAFERLHREGISVIPVSDGEEAASRFEPNEGILLLGDGIAPPVELLVELADGNEAAVITVADDEQHQEFERVDAESRWAGLALVDGGTLRATASMLGDWDLQSTLLRRTLQSGAPLLRVPADKPEPLLAATPDDLVAFERQLVVGSRGVRNDLASRYLLPVVEDFATERLMESRVRPDLLLLSALVLTGFAAFAFTRGWHWPALAALLLSTPLDLVARRLAALRLRPLPARVLQERLLWPAAGLALIALGWWEARHEGGWGALLAAMTAVAFAQALQNEKAGIAAPAQPWLFSRRNAIILALPFAAFGAWTPLTVVLALYAAASFFVVQHLRHGIEHN